MDLIRIHGFYHLRFAIYQYLCLSYLPFTFYRLYLTRFERIITVPYGKSIRNIMAIIYEGI